PAPSTPDSPSATISAAGASFPPPPLPPASTNPFNITDPAIAADSVKSINSAESRLFPKNLDAAG
ncbi:TPA: hypothetical protein WMF54_001994, partial [Neisseria gonorrhoeae]